MSETSSDAESSCGWTIISNEGSDIESLGLENAPEDGIVSPEVTPVVLPELHDLPTSLSGAECEDGSSDVLEDTLKEETNQQILSEEDGVNALGTEPVTMCSSSDHSDIMTLGDLKEDDHAAAVEEAVPNEEFYLGTSSSSQYTFTAVETVFPVLQPQVANSSSSEDDALESPTSVVRRRRLRKNTTSTSEAPDEEIVHSAHSEDDSAGQDVHLQQADAQFTVPPPLQGPLSSTLNKCILLALVIAVSMGFGHFCGTFQSRERQKVMVNELGDARDLLKQHLQRQLSINQEVAESLRKDVDENDIVEFITGIISKENEEFRLKQAQLEVQLEIVVMQLKQSTEERSTMESLHYKLTTENQLLKSSLEREQNSLFALQEELKNLRSKVGDLEDRGAGAESLRSENQRLNDQLEEERQRIRSFLSKREALLIEVQTLRKELDKEQRVKDQLRKELEELSIGSMKEEVGTEEEDLQSRLVELEKKLSFEQQRSDLWERLYVETKEERAKGDTQPKVKKHGMLRKVKDTFNAMKNSTKEFVHHHKEQIKKAKEAVKENLRKFSDSVKSTFSHFKDSASNFMKDRGSHSRRFHETEAKESWQQSAHNSNKENSFKSTDHFQSTHNTRKYGGKVQEPEVTHDHKATPKDCFSVFDCAYQESMSLFNIAMEPIRADEFHQLLQSYLQQEVDHFQHWKEVEKFINNFFHNGVFIHDQMLFTDFVSGVEDYLVDIHQYHSLDDNVFENLDEYVYRHFFGETYAKNGPSRPDESSHTKMKEDQQLKQQQRKQQKARARPVRERKWSRSGRNSDRHMADVKIELGPMPFDPKY